MVRGAQRVSGARLPFKSSETREVDVSVQEHADLILVSRSNTETPV
jgi:hypothetical protein